MPFTVLLCIDSFFVLKAINGLGHLEDNHYENYKLKRLLYSNNVKRGACKKMYR